MHVVLANRTYEHVLRRRAIVIELTHLFHLLICNLLVLLIVIELVLGSGLKEGAGQILVEFYHDLLVVAIPILNRCGSQVFLVLVFDDLGQHVLLLEFKVSLLR